MRPQAEPGLQNRSEPVATQHQNAAFDLPALILAAIVAAIAACVWIGMAVFGISTGT